MPIYEYRCDNGHTFEVLQRMSDDPLASCTTCHARVQRVFHPVAVHFKGSGFYSTDYAKKGSANSDETKPKAGSDDAGKSSSDGAGASSPSKSDGSDSKPKAGSSESKSSKS